MSTTTKDSTETFVRSSTDDKNKNSADKSYDFTDASYSTTNKSGTSGTSTTYIRQQQQQDSEPSREQWSRPRQGQQEEPYGFHSQQEVQEKLKQVGLLLQKAGSLLQDLQIGAADLPGAVSSPQRGGGNFGGPFTSSEPYYPGQQNQELNWDQQGQRWQASQPSGRWEDRDERPSYRAGYYARDPDRYGSEFRGGSSSDRFAYGGPGRQDFASGSQCTPDYRGGRQDWGRGSEWDRRGYRW